MPEDERFSSIDLARLMASKDASISPFAVTNSGLERVLTAILQRAKYGPWTHSSPATPHWWDCASFPACAIICIARRPHVIEHLCRVGQYQVLGTLSERFLSLSLKISLRHLNRWHESSSQSSLRPPQVHPPLYLRECPASHLRPNWA